MGTHQLIVYQYILQLMDTTLVTMDMKVVHQTIIKAMIDKSEDQWILASKKKSPEESKYQQLELWATFS